MIPPDSAAREVIVTGAGPAGLACACRLRRHGRDVLVLDRFMVSRWRRRL